MVFTNSYMQNGCHILLYIYANIIADLKELRPVVASHHKFA
jgi:hypothetical protein